MSRDIFLNIDRIVLRGLNHIDRSVLAAALQQALVDQLTSSPSHNPADLSRVRTNITLPAAFGSAQLGQTLAQSLYGVISSNEGTTKPGPVNRQGGRHDA